MKKRLKCRKPGPVEKSIQSFLEAGKLYHKFTEVWDKLGYLYSKSGKLEESRISYKKAFKISGDFKYAYRQGIIYMMESDYHKALECFHEIKTPDNYADLSENYSVCYFYTGDYKNAILKAQEVSLRKDLTALLYFILGSSNMKIGSIQNAERNLKEGLTKYPEDINLLYSMGLLEANRNEFKKAVDYLEKALEKKKSADIYYALGLCMMKLDHKQQAYHHFENYLQYYQNDCKVLFKIALIYIELNLKDKSRILLEKILKIDPGHQKARDFLKNLNK